MFKLKTGYFLTGIATGLVIFFSFLWTLPDGKLRIVFCDVGQGDGAYVKFPDGRDMVVDGGPDEKKIINCLSRHMPFWDRRIDLVMMTHPQKDHMQGLISVLDRYDIGYFVRSDVDNTTEGYKRLLEVVERKKINVRYVTSGEVVKIDKTQLSFIWPSREQIAKGNGQSDKYYKSDELVNMQTNNNILGTTTVGDLNDYSLVFTLSYGNFDVLFTGDADNRVNREFIGRSLMDEVEVLKVPHHGSKTGMTDDFLDWIKPKLAIISVGRNSYGHPAEQILEKLSLRNIKIKRTDQDEDVEVVSDGKSWTTSLTHSN